MKEENKIKFTFLGTGTSTGVPLIGCKCDVCISNDDRDKRLRSSVLISTNNKNVAIDCGPDFRYQMIRSGVERLDAIILTHEHRDHIAGLDDIRAFNYTMKKNMPVYCSERTLKAIELQFPYIFSDDKYRGSPEIEIHVIENRPFYIDDIFIEPVEVMHHNLPVLGFKIGSTAYITDASYISDTEMEKLKDVDVLIINALRKQKHFSHFSLDEAIEIIKKLNAGKAYLTHISHMLGKHKEICAELPGNISLAYDKLVIEC